MLHSIFEHARKVAQPSRRRQAVDAQHSGGFDFYSPEEVQALVRAAATDQDSAIYLTAAFTGLRRGELLGLHVRDIGFATETIHVRRGVTNGIAGTPKSGKVRSVPMVDEVAQALAKLLQREELTGDDDPVFVGEGGGYVDGSALRRRFKDAQTRAELRELRFHDLRHTFGSLAARMPESPRELQPSPSNACRNAFSAAASGQRSVFRATKKPRLCGAFT